MKTRILSAVALTIILTLALGPVAHAQYTANFQTNTICCGGTMTSGDYVVGSNTYSDVLIFTMTEGSGLSDANGYLGYLAGSSNNVAIINIPESGWYNMGGNFYVGYSGSGNSVLITNGAFVITNYGVIGTNPGANRNAVTVTGGESVWENNASILIGDYGTSNTLTIATGAHVNDPIGQIGYESGANYNAVTVTSPGDFGYGWDNTGTLNVGTSGSGDTLTIADGGSVYDADGNIGLNSNGGSNNVVTVTGTNSVWNNSTNLAIGYAGSDNELVIANGGNVSSTTGFLGYNTDANGNGVTVTGVDSVWDNSGDIYIGYSGSGNSVIIAPGSSFLQGVDAVNGWIGYNTGANGNIISVSGTGSVWNSTGDVYVGNAGSSNTLTISDGGTVADAIGYIGYESGANYNLAEVALPGSVWNNSGAVTVGASGMNNELYISEGGVVFDTYGYIGYNTGTNENYVGVASGNSVWNNSADLYVGYSGSENELDIEPQDGLSQSVNNVNGWIGYNASANGNFVYVYLVASVWNNSGNLYVGNFGSGNELEISSGGVVSNNATAYIGSNAGANNNSVFVTEGALWKCNAPLYVGYGGSGSTLAIDDGGRVSDTYGNIGGAPGSESNAATVTGAGAVWNNTAGLSVGSSGSSSNTLTIANGGSLFVTNVAGNAALVVSSSAGPNTLSINGGSVTVNALIATNGLNSVVTFPAGTLASGGTSVSNTRLFAVGDGTDAATFQLNGGVHSFANNLEIRSNATLTGCGTIEGNVTVDPGGTMQTLCNPLAVNGIVTNNGTIIAANGDSIYFEGPVVNNGLIDAITGGVEFPGGLVNNGCVLTEEDLQTQISSITRSGTNIIIQIPSVGCLTYQLQVTPSLTPMTWTNLDAPQNGTDGVLTFTDFSGATNSPGRFYRIAIMTPLANVIYSNQSVSAQANIYGAGMASPPAPGGGGAGVLPTGYALPTNAVSVTFSNVTGSIVVDLYSGDDTNDPDGVGAAVGSSSNTGFSPISGIKAPNAGYIVGVFIGGPIPTNAPPSLNFTYGAGNNPGTTAFTSLSPLLYQTFFIGDGLTGDGTGATQIFNVPAGATSLYLGISDANGYNGSPGAYGDNTGNFTIGSITVTLAVPPP